MAAIAQFQAERAEFDAVLRSNLFHRAPNLASVFRYTCERYFAGEGQNIKEYNIAIEALGRPADFNQKKDSIVRVEAHRLRKRLSEYYAGEGANHPVHITIPAGQYIPQFLVHGAEIETPPPAVEAALAVELPAAVFEEAPPAAIVASGPRFIWIALVLLFLAGGAAGTYFWVRTDPALPARWLGSMRPVEGDLRFLAGYGGEPFRDRQGRTWQSDRYYNGGRAVPLTPSQPIEGSPDPALVRSNRQGTFNYDIPMVPGDYELRLYFVETKLGIGGLANAANARLFRVNLNGKLLLNLFDVLEEAGAPNRLHVRVFRDVSPGADGLLHLSFQQITDVPAILSAIEVLPTVPGHVRPIRIVAQAANVADADDALWQADEYGVGGIQVNRTFTNGSQRMLFRGERYGNFAYRIPAAAGKYRLRLYFAETYFGTNLPFAQNNAGAPRVFNVFANGVALIRDLDVAKEAQGSNKPLVREFENLEPNAQGLFVLEFVPVHNYAEVNAIEIVPMG